MGITIPSELDYVLDLLGYEWPNIDEDAVRELATLMRLARDDMEETLDALDRRINTDLAEAFKCKSAASYIQAFTENRTQNMNRFLDIFTEAADGVDLFADAVVVLKMKVIAELTITAAQIAAAAATAVVTAGASVAANAAIIAARKKAMDVATGFLTDQISDQAMQLVIVPLRETLPGVFEAMIDWPITTWQGGEAPAFEVSFDLMEQLADALEDCGDEQADILETFACRAESLPYTQA